MENKKFKVKLFKAMGILISLLCVWGFSDPITYYSVPIILGIGFVVYGIGELIDTLK